MIKNFKKDLGFTLIELLVVMVIIGILASISLFGLRNARADARDGRRRSALEQIRSGLELYRADCNEYPAALPAHPNALTGTGSPPGPPSCLATNTYISEVPEDPVNTQFFLYQRPTPTTYELCASLEGGGTGPVGCNGDTNCGEPCNYRVTNP
jgi:general secretion pathway protein G